MSEYTRESLALEAGRSFGSEPVCRILERLFASRGTPAAMRMDNGPEFVALALKGLCHRYGINGVYIEPGRAPAVPEAVAEWLCREFHFRAARRVYWTGECFCRRWTHRCVLACGVGTSIKSGCIPVWSARRLRSSRLGRLLAG